MTFTDLCEEWKVTPDERMKLARYLATLRAEATLKLGTPPVAARTCDTTAYCSSVQRCTRADSDRSLRCAAVPCGVGGMDGKPEAPPHAHDPETPA